MDWWNAAVGGGGEKDAPRLLGDGDAVRELDAGEIAPLPAIGVDDRLEIPNRAMAAAVESALVFTARPDGFGATGFTGIGGF